MQPRPDGPLVPADYERILGVLCECDGVSSLPAFRETLMESLAKHFGYRHGILLIGPTRSGMFGDTSALHTARNRASLSAYIEHYHRWDPLPQLAARRGVTASGRTVTLDQTRPYLTAENRLYIDQHLYKGGIHAALVTEAAREAVHLGLALFDEQESAFGARDVAIMQHLGRLLTRQAELLSRLPPTPAWAAALTRREAEVARLVARSCTNQEIAATLHITVDTVKKHVKAACAKAGAPNRAGLAARMTGLCT